MRIAANRAKEVLRSRWHRSVSPSEDWEAQAAAIAAAPSPEEDLADREDMLRALGKLDDKSRRALLLHYYYGFRDREIAVIEDLSPAAVRKRIERGRNRLGELLAEDGKGSNHEPG
jgi:RNA polymerase sigma-70 factor (ECF subfamily)